MSKVTLKIGGKLDRDTKLRLQQALEAVQVPGGWAYFVSQRIDAAIHDKVPLEFTGNCEGDKWPEVGGLYAFLMDEAKLQFALVGEYKATVFGPWVPAVDFVSEAPPEEWGMLSLRVTETGEPLLDAELVSKILEHAGSPYFHETALLQFFRKALYIPPLTLVV